MFQPPKLERLRTAEMTLHIRCKMHHGDVMGPWPVTNSNTSRVEIPEKITQVYQILPRILLNVGVTVCIRHEYVDTWKNENHVGTG